jgi:hypothetical protein
MVRRRQARPLAALLHLDGLQDAQRAARRVVGLEPGLVDEDHEGRRAAVEHRDLGAVHLDQHVVDAQGQQRRQQVLDGVHRDPVARERRRMVEPSEVVQGRRDLDGQVRAAETDAVLRRSRLEVEAHRLAGVQPDARATDRFPERPAITHGAPPSPVAMRIPGPRWRRD